MKITKDNKGYDLVDFEVAASTETKCDGCGSGLGKGSYPYKKGSISIALMDEPDEHGYETSNTYHACSEQCLATMLSKRQEARQAKLAKK
jgi:hypothetical protein